MANTYPEASACCFCDEKGMRYSKITEEGQVIEVTEPVCWTRAKQLDPSYKLATSVEVKMVEIRE